MKKLTKRVFSAPSIKLNTLVLCEIVSLLVVSLGILLFFSRETLVKEAKLDAEQRLAGTVQHVDNILLGVEQSAGNIYYDLLQHLDQPEEMVKYCRRVVQSNPDIDGCAIGIKPGYFPDSLFRVYVRKDVLKGVVTSPYFGHIPYTQQPWFKKTMELNYATWMYPFQQQEEERVITFCLPLPGKDGKPVGVMGVDLSVELLAKEVIAAKPTPNSYSVLVDSVGTFMIHPEKDKLLSHNVLSLADKLESPSMKAVAEAVLRGETGNSSFKSRGETWYIFFRPFERAKVMGRSEAKLGWHIGTVYPKKDIFDEYYHHVWHVAWICIVGLLLFYVFSRFAIRKMLRPLRRLTESAYSIAEGNYATTVPDTDRDDEVGMFQHNFKLMQDNLLADIEKQDNLKDNLHERREALRKAHEQIQEDDRVQTTFLHNVTNRLIPPSESILGSVSLLSDNYQFISRQEAQNEVINIKNQSDTIFDLLIRKFKASYNKEEGKEDKK